MKVQWFKVHSKARSRLSSTHLHAHQIKLSISLHSRCRAQSERIGWPCFLELWHSLCCVSNDVL